MNFILSADKIDASHMKKQFEMQKRKEYIDKHPYKIWKGKDGKWYSYLPDEKKGRILKKRASETEIEDVIIDYWEDKLENPTVDELFNEWIAKKLEREEITKATRDRYCRQYKESFTKFGKMKIREIDEYAIEDFMLSTLHEKNMTAKGFSNFRTLIFGIFKYAKKKRYINYSITEVVNDIEISRKSFRKNKKSDEEMVFMENELPIIMNYLEENEDIINIGLIIMFKSGLRVGELAALKCDDIQGNVIHVHRTEVCYEEDGKRIFEVRDFPKTEAGVRDVIFPEKYAKYLNKAKQTSTGGYLLESDGERLKTYQFRSRLKVVCKNVNIVSKSPHKIRKTYASILIDSGISESVIISQMGHTDINTTKNFYYRNRKGEEKKRELIDSLALL